MTILIVVATINAVNFIDGLDGLAAGVVGISALALHGLLLHADQLGRHPVRSRCPRWSRRCWPASASGSCRTTSTRPGSSWATPGRCCSACCSPTARSRARPRSTRTSWSTTRSNKPVDRFATILPLLLPVAILIIPYTDLLLAVVRRMLAGKSPFAADRQHLHHRLQNMGHSHRQTVLLMYLWAALFSGTVVGLSVIRVAAGLAGPRHRRRGDRAAARDHAGAPPVAVHRQARRRYQETSPDGRHHGPFHSNL